MKIKNIHFIINPAAGRVQPILPIINQVVTEAKIDWDISITKKKDDALRLAKEAVKKKFDVVAAYGGDGTVAGVIAGLIGSDIPLAILPGGTGNVLSKELGISQILKEACELITKGPHELRPVDIAQFDQRYFVLRVGLGFEAEMVKGAQQKHKNRFGALAYTLSSFAAAKKAQHAIYDLTIDGKSLRADGLTCMITNSGNLGLTGLTFDKNISVSDGLLDVVVIRKANLNFWVQMMRTLINGEPPDDRELVQHWQGKIISVSSEPKQFIQCDGEILEIGQLTAKIIPSAIRIFTPVTNEKH